MCMRHHVFIRCFDVQLNMECIYNLLLGVYQLDIFWSPIVGMGFAIS